jgi:Thaumatin family
MSTTLSPRREGQVSPSRIFLSSLLFLGSFPTATAYTTNRYIINNAGPLPRPARWGPPEKRDSVPLVISNQCEATIWPGIGTQAGTGAGTGGFELAPGSSKSLMVSADWQGRVWGRTNCSFNVAGTGASNLNGNNGGGAACKTGDCGGVLSCVITVKLTSFPSNDCHILTFYAGCNTRNSCGV